MADEIGVILPTAPGYAPPGGGEMGISRIEQGGVDPTTGEPTSSSIPAGEKVVIKRIDAKGVLNFIMVRVDNKNVNISLTVDGDDIFSISPFRLFQFGLTEHNDYVWCGKYDDTNNQFSVIFAMTIPFDDYFELIAEGTTTGANLLDWSIFWAPVAREARPALEE